MNQAALEKLLLVEVHRFIDDAARGSMSKFGMTVPLEARAGYVTEEESDFLKAMGSGPLDL